MEIKLIPKFSVSDLVHIDNEEYIILSVDLNYRFDRIDRNIIRINLVNNRFILVTYSVHNFNAPIRYYINTINSGTVIRIIDPNELEFDKCQLE